MNLELILLAIIIFLLIIVIFAYKMGKNIGLNQMNQKWIEDLPNHRKDAIERSRLVLSGNFSEQLAPYLPDFKYSPTECKFLGKPIDLVVFKGSDQKKIEEIIFVEVKSGESKISPQEKNLKEVIQNKKIKWEEYRVPKRLTEKKE